jgi:citronellol/citronellal dehydrogenase
MYQSVFAKNLFQEKVVVVTGAGSGIGRCTAHELASLGAQVVLIGRNVEKLKATSLEIQEQNGRVSWESLDIRQEEQVERAFESIQNKFGKIDALVNNAGGQFPAPLEAISLKGWEAVLKTNLTGGYLCAIAALQLSMKDRGGAIVNIIADMWNGMPGMGHSGAARAGMLNFTETAAVEWARYGVRVNAVAPGWIASSGFDTYDSKMQAELKRLQKVVPSQRFGTESEVAAAIVFLLSPAANFISGSCIRVDGAVPNARHTWPTQMATSSESTIPFNGFHLASLPKMLRD